MAPGAASGVRIGGISCIVAGCFGASSRMVLGGCRDRGGYGSRHGSRMGGCCSCGGGIGNGAISHVHFSAAAGETGEAQKKCQGQDAVFFHSVTSNETVFSTIISRSGFFRQETISKSESGKILSIMREEY